MNTWGEQGELTERTHRFAGTDIIGLGLESSCDETAVAIIKNGKQILSNTIFSQIRLHEEYFGVVP